MEIVTMFNEIPFLQHLGIEVTDASGGCAEGQIELSEELSLYQDRHLAHGGVSFALADTVGAAAIASLVEAAVPTVDMRIDYLRPATTDLRAVGRVFHAGDRVSTVHVDLFNAEEERVATAVGVYKTDGGDSIGSGTTE